MAKDTEQKYSIKSLREDLVKIYMNKKLIFKTDGVEIAVARSNLCIANEISRLNDHLEDSEKRIENALKEGLKQGFAFAEKMENQKEQQRAGQPESQATVGQPHILSWYCSKCDKHFPAFIAIPSVEPYMDDEREIIICPYCGSTVEG